MTKQFEIKNLIEIRIGIDRHNERCPIPPEAILMNPVDCKLFGSVCTPENPVGSCMVSTEGACSAHYSYGRYRDRTDMKREARSDMKDAA